MPKLSEIIKTEKVVLPESGAELILLKSIPFGASIGVAESEDKGLAKMGIATITAIVKSWNFQTDDGEVAPINEESILQIPVNDINFLIDYTSKITSVPKEAIKEEEAEEATK